MSLFTAEVQIWAYWNDFLNNEFYYSGKPCTRSTDLPEQKKYKAKRHSTKMANPNGPTKKKKGPLN